jgi:hypothetical protein
MLRGLALLALLLAANTAFADTLTVQTATSSSLTGNTNDRPILSLATSTYATVPQWNLDSITMQLRGCTGIGCSGLTGYLIAEVYNGTAWIGVATSSTETITSGSSPETIQFDFSTFNLADTFDNVSGAKPYFVSPATGNYWYRFSLKTTALGLTDSHIVYGTGVGTTSAPFIWRRQDGNTIIPAILFTGTDVTDTTTRIDSLDTPANGATTATETVNFQWTVYYNDTTSTQDVTGIEVSNISSGSTIVPPAEQVLTASGYSVYNATLTLDANEEYLWRAYLRDTTGTQGYVYSGYQSFFVVSNPFPQSLNVASTSVGSTTASLIPNYNSLAEYIKTKPPFGFIFQTIAALESLNASSTPAFELEQEDNVTENIISPLDVGLAWIIGLLFTMYILRRFSHIEI